MTVQSEIAMKFKDRLEKNRDKLFTFLSFDGVPWNNNNAEHAVKPFAALRHIIGGVTTEKGIRDYLSCSASAKPANTWAWTFSISCGREKMDIHAFREVGPRRKLERCSQGCPKASDSVVSLGYALLKAHEPPVGMAFHLPTSQNLLSGSLLLLFPPCDLNRGFLLLRGRHGFLEQG